MQGKVKRGKTRPCRGRHGVEETTRKEMKVDKSNKKKKENRMKTEKKKNKREKE